ncbi:MAG: GIY-YIG nuclease family protein [Patescibacteria group bacterium]
MFYIYFLKSKKNEKVYTGITEKDPLVRLKEHNNGSNQWTKKNGPFKLLYYEKYFCKQDALSKEKFYKTGIGRKIRNLILVAVSAKGGPASGGG